MYWSVVELHYISIADSCTMLLGVKLIYSLFTMGSCVVLYAQKLMDNGLSLLEGAKQTIKE